MFAHAIIIDSDSDPDTDMAEFEQVVAPIQVTEPPQPLDPPAAVRNPQATRNPTNIIGGHGGITDVSTTLI